jgi:hypothetical protein
MPADSAVGGRYSVPCHCNARILLAHLLVLAFMVCATAYTASLPQYARCEGDPVLSSQLRAADCKGTDPHGTADISDGPAARRFRGWEIPQLSAVYAKVDSLLDTPVPGGRWTWPCTGNPAPGGYETTLETSSTTSFFDLSVFLVPTALSNRRLSAAKFVDSETAQGSVRLEFDIPGRRAA